MNILIPKLILFPKRIVTVDLFFLQITQSYTNKFFIGELNDKAFTIDKTGQKTIELTGASFLATEPAIFGTPDENVEDAKQIFSVARKSTENREIVQFELAAALDMANVRCPNRICTRKDFPSIGTFIG